MDAAGIVVLGCSFDTVEANAKFATKEAFPFALLCDTSRAIGLAYGATAPGETGNARRISYLIGADATILHAWPKVSVGTHAKDVLDVSSRL